jgi:hypothetical protein
MKKRFFNFAPLLDSGYALKPKNSAFNAMWLKTRHYCNTILL